MNGGQGTLGALNNDKTMYKEASASATALRENMEALKHNFFLRGFFKQRGYEDSDELTKYAIQRLPTDPPMKTFAYDAQRLFDKPDTAKLKDQKMLDEAGKFLESQKFGLAVVAANTGMKGDTDKDRLLTQARTMVVRDYFAKNFRLDDTRMKTIGLGKTEEPGDSGQVKILVYPAGSKIPAAQNPPQGSRSRPGE